MSNERDLGGDTLPDGIRGLQAQTEALRAKLREARKRGLSPEEQARIDELIVALAALLGEHGI